MKLFYDQACIVCRASTPGRKIGEVREHEYQTTTERFPVYLCPGCGLVYLYPRPDLSELALIYPREYYSYDAKNQLQRAGESARRTPLQRVFLELNRRRLAARLGPAMSGSAAASRKVIDIGCGTGNVLDIVRSTWSAETWGVEIDGGAVTLASAAGHRVVQGAFEEVSLDAEAFDVAISNHVIEHVADPRRFLEKAHTVLRPGGFLLLETPNTDSLDFRLLKRRHWGGYHAPRHFYLFCHRTLTELARQVGFRCVAWSPCRASAFWIWSAHSLLTDTVGPVIADALVPPTSFLHGGLHAFALLSVATVLEGALLSTTGKASAIWLLLQRG